MVSIRRRKNGNVIIMSIDYCSVTELTGEKVTREQVERLYHRYYWAGEYCLGKDVLEVACGNGQGLGYLATKASSLVAGDIEEKLIQRVEKHYGSRISINLMDAQKLPLDENSLDVVILFEAIYYLPDPKKFMTECARVLRKGGQLLIVTTNKDLFDFNPSPFSHKYFGVVELADLMKQHHFIPSVFGYWPISKSSVLQKALRPIKKIAVALGLVPKTMEGKKMLKRLIFGKLVTMPVEIESGMIEYSQPEPISQEVLTSEYNVIYCSGILTS